MDQDLIPIVQKTYDFCVTLYAYITTVVPEPLDDGSGVVAHKRRRKYGGQAVLTNGRTERIWSSRRASIADSGTTVTTIASPTALNTSSE